MELPEGPGDETTLAELMKPRYLKLMHLFASP